LALCEAAFPKKLVFGYLEELEREFSEQYGAKVLSVSRPYFFIEFGEKHLIYFSAIRLYNLTRSRFTYTTVPTVKVLW